MAKEKFYTEEELVEKMQNGEYGWLDYVNQQIRGVRPFFSDKFDITKHKQYPLLYDYDKKKEFDIEKYVKNRNRLRFKRDDVVDEVCDVGEITA